MAVPSLVSNAVSTATGTVQKAVIRFRDRRYLAEADQDKKETEELKSSPNAPGGLGAVSSLNAFTPDIGGAIMNAVTGAMGISSNSDYDKSIVVQFNPTSIRLQSHAGDDDVSKMNYKQDGMPGISNGSMDLHVDMSVDLIFDQVSNMASFKSDVLNLSIASKANDIASAVGSKALGALTGTGKVSVQQIVEAFVALMRNPLCRDVCFEWGDLKYEGTLRSCNTTYTMFDMLGNPVRAKVTLTIYLVETIMKKVQDYTNGYWYDAYYEAYIKGNPIAETMIRMMDWGAD
ncbi:MAG: hypothetical protein IKR23_08075 [Lachnospiraceae bacterium]|nr:hypothetical protein [Lachnospiraceae bacterium]